MKVRKGFSFEVEGGIKVRNETQVFKSTLGHLSCLGNDKFFLVGN